MSSARFCEVTVISCNCPGVASPSAPAAALLVAAWPAGVAAIAMNAKNCAASGGCIFLITSSPAYI